MPTSTLIWLLPAVLGLLYFTGCLYLYTQQRQMIFAPVRALTTTPASKGLDYEELWISLAPGSEDALYGWWIPAEPSHELGVLLLLHGKACTISYNVERAARFHQLGFTVLLADYRGYGRSTGPFPNEQRVYEDAEALWQYLTVERGVAPGSILIYGHSLGGAIAIELATRHPDAGCLMVESSFTAMRDMAAQNPYLSPFPTDRLLTQQFDSLSKVQRPEASSGGRSLPMPKLFAHGEQDDTVPCSMSQALYQAAPEPKKLLIDVGADHETVAEFAGEAYKAAVLDLAQSLASADSTSVNPL